ncbi:MAG: tRNA (adenosine(37)-N6)-threonylcarbamoyltransferase complex dimerization subunit type 1 TsaB [Actinomycetota bacterium]|nr:tRNA (adenosine(37)-N6)-threonylcarbamoyltransferase complex dimerization subunit type 1 TsaB [Actinomycetota bacterium]
MEPAGERIARLGFRLVVVLILGITSSTARVGVAVGRIETDSVTVLAETTSSDDRRHAEDATPLMLEALNLAGVTVQDIGRLAVDVGPGRFTGLRVGFSTVRALAFALDLPVTGVSSLEVLAAEQGPTAQVPVASVIDARRSEVFQQVYGPDGPVGPPLVGPALDLAPTVPGNAVALGDGADRYLTLYSDRVAVVSGREPSPSWLLRLAAFRPALDAANVEPLYLRDPDVQINIRTRHA